MGIARRRYVYLLALLVATEGNQHLAPTTTVAVIVAERPYSLAILSKAARSIGGSSFPLFSARRRIPRAALGLKEYFCGTSPSKMPDNEHTAAALGHSKVLSVKYPPAPHIPEFCQPSKDDGKISPPSTG
jgi:hypothetical protein